MSEAALGESRAMGPYLLDRVLGSGGMGQVYLGRDADGTRVAVKVIHAHLALNPEFRRRLRREAEACAKVRAPGVVAVTAADIDGDPPWIATEYVDGPSLFARVTHGGPLSADECRQLGAGLAAALAAAHGAGLVHRDVTPSNVLLAAEGPVLIDFGIARDAAASILTRTGFALGTPQHMSPEQIQGHREVGPPSDVFSLGGLLVFATTGRSPFGEGTAPALSYRLVHEQPRLDGVPDALVGIVEQCLAKDPGQRPSAAEVAEVLRKPFAQVAVAVGEGGGIGIGEAVHDHNTLIAEEPTHTVPESEPRWWLPGSTRRTARLTGPATIGAVVVALIVLTAVFLTPGSAGRADATAGKPDHAGGSAASAVTSMTVTPTLPLPTPTPPGPTTMLPSPGSPTTTAPPTSGISSVAVVTPPAPQNPGPSGGGKHTSPDVPTQPSVSTTAPSPPKAPPGTQPSQTTSPPPPPTTPACTQASAPCRTGSATTHLVEVENPYGPGKYWCLYYFNGMMGIDANCSLGDNQWKVWNGSRSGTVQLESMAAPGKCVARSGSPDLAPCDPTSPGQWLLEVRYGSGFELRSLADQSCLDNPGFGPCSDASYLAMTWRYA